MLSCPHNFNKEKTYEPIQKIITHNIALPIKKIPGEKPKITISPDSSLCLMPSLLTVDKQYVMIFHTNCQRTPLTY